MAGHRFKILYVGRKGTAVTKVRDLLERAGYSAELVPTKVSTKVSTKLGRGRSRDGAGSRDKVRSMTLRQLRESVGRTQGDVARAVAMTQPQLSRVEGRTDHLLSTLRRYVRALGGEVEIVARVKGARVSLQDV